MKGYSRRQKTLFSCICAGWILLAGSSFAASRPMKCDGQMPAKHIDLTPGDQNTPSHLQMSRKVAAGTSVEIDVCSADVTVVASKNDTLGVALDVVNPSSKATAVDYVQAFDVAPDGAQLQLHLTKHAHARVVVEVPASAPRLKVDLVRGDLTFQADRIGGERKIDVVHGHVEIEGNADAYASLKLDVLMGSFHDRRSNEAAHGMVTQSLTGTGKGSIAVDVVMGSVEIRPWD